VHSQIGPDTGPGRRKSTHHVLARRRNKGNSYEALSLSVGILSTSADAEACETRV
jgi:hypothetical protein